MVDGIHFVAALTASRFPELMATPQGEFSPVPGMPGSRAHAAETQLWGRDCRLVVTYTESFFTQQLSGVTNNTTLAGKVVREAGIDLPLLKDLSGIREVTVIYPPGTLARPRDHTTLSLMSPRQKKLLEFLDVGNVIS